MTTPQATLDHLVRAYLDAVARNLVGVPEDRRRELLADLADHIAAERATLDEPTETDVRTILERLGDPVAVAAEARIDAGPPPWQPAAPPVAPAPVVRRGPGTVGWVLIAALGLFVLVVLMVCVGLFGLRTASVDSGTPAVVPATPAPSGP